MNFFVNIRIRSDADLQTVERLAADANCLVVLAAGLTTKRTARVMSVTERNLQTFTDSLPASLRAR